MQQPRPYQQPGLTLSEATPGAAEQVRALQRDLRALGYLRRGIDGVFGVGTRLAVQGLQHDLLHNRGEGRDGRAAVRMVDYERGRVGAVTGVVDQRLAACLAELMRDPAVPKLPRTDYPVAENRWVVRQLEALPPGQVPVRFLLAVLRQESGLMHFAQPAPGSGDEDTFILVGTDRNAEERHVITSRGYGVGQYTLFHHPPRLDEVNGMMRDPAWNVAGAVSQLRQKLEWFVVGPVDKADDRVAEVGTRAERPLRLCRYAPDDARYMRDCTACVRAAGTRDVTPGQRVYPGSRIRWAPTDGHPSASYARVPVRERVGCDWPYAVRRYNGGGLASYHYQARVLKVLAE